MHLSGIHGSRHHEAADASEPDAHARAAGSPSRMLFPYSIPLYRRMGWEIISNKISYTVKDRQIPSKAKAPGYVRRVDWENQRFHESARPLRRRDPRLSVPKQPCLGGILALGRGRHRSSPSTTTCSDTPTGYMVYLIKDDVMHIKEMIYLDSRGARWAFGSTSAPTIR